MIGPINNAKQFDHVRNLVADGIAEGAPVAAGGQRAEVGQGEHGYFYQPTVLATCRTTRCGSPRKRSSGRCYR